MSVNETPSPEPLRQNFQYFLKELQPYENELGNRLWWWHWLYGTGKYSVRLNSQLQQYFSWALPMIFERSAYLYELEARMVGEYEFETSWPYLDLRQKQALALKWPIDGNKRESLREDLESGQKRKGWTDATPMSFNLQKTDKELTRIFLQYIHEQRQIHAIHDPETQGRGDAKRINWRAIELMDLELFNIRRLDPYEKEEAEEAKQEYKSLNIR